MGVNFYVCVLYRYSRQPQRFGACVMGYDDIYDKLRSFQRDVKTETSRPGCSKRDQRYYFVSVDVEKCYDNIQLNKLMELLRELLREDEYVVFVLTRRVWDFFLAFSFSFVSCTFSTVKIDM